jgi:hypothetical protein
MYHHDDKTKHEVIGATKNDVLTWDGSSVLPTASPTIANAQLTTATITSETVAASNTTKLTVTGTLVSNIQPYYVTTITSLTTATNYTMTVAQLLGGFTSDVPTVNCTAILPTVAQVVAAIPNYINGTTFTHVYRVAPASAQAIVIGADANTQWTLLGNVGINTNTAKTFNFIVTNAISGTVYPTMVYSIAT